MADPWALIVALGVPAAGALAWLRFRYPRLYLRSYGWIVGLLCLVLTGLNAWRLSGVATLEAVRPYIAAGKLDAAEASLEGVTPHIAAIVLPAALALWGALILLLDPDDERRGPRQKSLRRDE